MLALLRRRQAWYLLAALFFTLLLIWSFWSMPHRSNWVNVANFDKIHDGMTRADLEELLGANNLRSIGYSRTSHACFFSQDDESWLLPGDVIVVAYEGGQLTEKRYCRPTPEDIVQRIGTHLRRCLGR